MRSSFTVTTGLKLARTPSARDWRRRRVAVVSGLLALGIAGGIAGALTAPHRSAELAPRTGPFSYFPSE
jgi:hypothetical protein